MCAEGIDFGEEPVYDFARCIKKTGEVYGVSPGEVCREGKPISDTKAERAKSKKPDTRLAKLKIAFRKKMGRDLTPEELKKAQAILGKIGASELLKQLNP